MFILTGVMGLLLAVCWFKFYKSKAQYMAETGRAEPVPVQQAKAPKVRWTSLFKDRNTWGAFLGFMGVIYMIWLNLTWLPGYFELAGLVSACLLWSGLRPLRLQL